MSEDSVTGINEKAIVLTLILLNDTDGMLGERGFLPVQECRGCVVDVVVNTRVAHLCLPTGVIEKLGLEKLGRMKAQTEVGFQTINVYGWVRFDVDGGIDGVYRCIELPDSDRAVLGRIPLEDMGLQPDWENQALQKIPIRV